jgi:hypothetical protein
MSAAKTPTMTTSKTPLRARASFVVLAGLASLLGGCVIEAKIGDDPEDDGGTIGETESPPLEATSTTSTSGYTSGAEPGDDSATTSGGSSASVTATTSAPGEDSAAEDSASGAALDVGGSHEDALEQCEVPVVTPLPGDPVILESVLCDGGCLIEIETAVEVGLLDEYGECLCEALSCGPVVGGTSTSEGPVDTDSGEPDGCGEFPDGEESFICDCEMCSIVVNDVDGAWVEGEADLQGICECMCGGAGCGLPV